jgi:hypothetical protein
MKREYFRQKIETVKPVNQLERYFINFFSIIAKMKPHVVANIILGIFT